MEILWGLAKSNPAWTRAEVSTGYPSTETVDDGHGCGVIGGVNDDYVVTASTKAGQSGNFGRIDTSKEWVLLQDLAANRFHQTNRPIVRVGEDHYSFGRAFAT